MKARDCGFHCPTCNDELCERVIEPCSCCREGFEVGKMWKVHGNYYCSDCYMEIGYGKKLTK